MSVLQIDTPNGEARAHVQPVDEPVGALLLGHGAGGGVGAKDLVLAAQVAGSLDFTVVLVEQPYVVAGKRSSPAPAKLDQAWMAVVEQLQSAQLEGLPLVAGGRSAGARVACRTAARSGAEAVLCLALPLPPPGPPGKR